ncbi:hypothetical protein [Streptomyces sp. XC 2026]|uniref:hypothetical protein n=1 Tax=Streptomyces sp. XC 2026 TaxID=2782004 RepID=UPI001904BB26|nr:hypothetical protein [Streptomyces sp. XC 2026]QQN79771.1 hypothetical protein IPZ77_21840 [Streptomyces sp. XC 2026]QQN80621.1 hypothetical protein IPZ77_26815 [Streptomyces sp. XC 2026]
MSDPAPDPIANLRRQLAAERDARADAESRLAIGGRQYSDACDRVIELTTQVCQLETQLAATQRQLDAALGMDDPAVEAGAHWQSHRTDLPTVPQPITPAPRAPLPRRTSAETAAWRMIRDDDIPLDAVDARPNTGTEAA